MGLIKRLMNRLRRPGPRGRKKYDHDHHGPDDRFFDDDDNGDDSDDGDGNGNGNGNGNGGNGD